MGPRVHVSRRTCLVGLVCTACLKSVVEPLSSLAAGTGAKPSHLQHRTVRVGRSGIGVSQVKMSEAGFEPRSLGL